jgi:hypothetical protein
VGRGRDGISIQSDNYYISIYIIHYIYTVASIQAYTLIIII